jgi:hypothetical protein
MAAGPIKHVAVIVGIEDCFDFTQPLPPPQ